MKEKLSPFSAYAKFFHRESFSDGEASWMCSKCLKS